MATSALRRALMAAAEALEGAAAELNRLDGYAGDGDMGVTMSEVARVVKEVVTSAEDMGTAQLLSACGAAVARSAPSTSGTLMATGFLRAAKAVASGPGDGVGILERAFAAAMEGIQARGKASVGDRTLLDGLDAVRSSLSSSISDGCQLDEALHRAAGAAAAAAETTASMEPKVGRASWVPQRAAGHPDPGCAMLAMVMKAVASSAGG